jgi:hypothetical protein
MGAYSPALVVGDGAIGFKGAENGASLMNILQGAATTGTTAAGAATPATSQALAAATTTEAAATNGVVTENQATAQLREGMRKNVVTRQQDEDEEEDLLEALEATIEDRDISGEDAILEAWEVTIEDREISGKDAILVALQTQIEDRVTVDAPGEERESERVLLDLADALQVKGRDLTGLNAALKSGPEVQLDTGRQGPVWGLRRRRGVRIGRGLGRCLWQALESSGSDFWFGGPTC